MSDEELISIWMRPERLERSGPGRRPGYSREQVTRAAVRIADSEGIEAATMRRIAGELGTGAMSLYRYVPRRDDLFDLMIDMVMGEVELLSRPSGDWRADLSLVAGRTRAAGLRHPWLIGLLGGRPTLGPQLLRVREFALGALDGLGLDIDAMAGFVGMLDDYVHSAVRREIGWLEHARRTGLDQERWKRDYIGPYVRQVVESGAYPLFNRSILESRIAHLTPEERFRYGLDRVLDGIGAGGGGGGGGGSAAPAPGRGGAAWCAGGMRPADRVGRSGLTRSARRGMVGHLRLYSRIVSVPNTAISTPADTSTHVISPTSGVPRISDRTALTRWVIGLAFTNGCSHPGMVDGST